MSVATIGAGWSTHLKQIVRWCLALMTSCVAVTGAVGQVTLEEALDGEGLVWTSGWRDSLPTQSDQPGWEGAPMETAFDGVDAVRPLTPSEFTGASWLRTTVTGPGVLRFHWKADGEETSESLYLMINGQYAPGFSVTSYWQICKIGLGEG